MPHSAITERQSLRDLDLASQLLDAHRPRRKLMRRVWARSAVALFLHQCPQEGLSVLMIRRADREGDPWSGHMAFPGGRKDKADRNTLATALRETEEEVGLQAEGVARLLGRLSDVAAHGRLRHGPMVVTPYVFGLPERFPLRQTTRSLKPYGFRSRSSPTVPTAKKCAGHRTACRSNCPATSSAGDASGGFR